MDRRSYIDGHSCLKGVCMVRRRQRERSLFEVLLPDGHKPWPDWLRRIDTLLEDEAVIETVASALEARWPQSRRRGRPGTPADVVLRMLVLKHLFDWSYDDLEREVRANLVYRAFTRIETGECRTPRRSENRPCPGPGMRSSSGISALWTSRSVPESRAAVAFASTPRS